MAKLAELPDEIVDDGHKFFRKETPKRTGNAQRNTRKRSMTISAEYPYASRLDSGWSKQAKGGMSDPTIKQMQLFTDNFTRKL